MGIFRTSWVHNRKNFHISFRLVQLGSFILHIKVIVKTDFDSLDVSGLQKCGWEKKRCEWSLTINRGWLRSKISVWKGHRDQVRVPDTVGREWLIKNRGGSQPTEPTIHKILLTICSVTVAPTASCLADLISLKKSALSVFTKWLF